MARAPTAQLTLVTEQANVAGHANRGRGSGARGARGRGRSWRDKGRGGGARDVAPAATQAETTKPSTMKCWTCQEVGHPSWRCPKKGEQQGQVAEILREELGGVGLLVDQSMTIRRDFWILDSGASCHIVNEPSMFNTYRKLETPITISGLTHKALIDTVGTVRRDIDAKTTLVLENVYYHPEAKHTLISMMRMMDKGWIPHLTASGREIRNGTKSIPLTRSGTILYLDFDQEVAAAASASIPSSLRQWHEKLGHIGIETLKKLAKMDVVHGLTFSDTDIFETKDCESCRMAKITKLPFDNEVFKASKPLHLVHSDLAGPLTALIDGLKYYCTFIDDFTGFMKVYNLTDKSQAKFAFRDFVRFAERAFDAKVKIIRIDGGGEYSGKEWDV